MYFFKSLAWLLGIGRKSRNKETPEGAIIVVLGGRWEQSQMYFNGKIRDQFRKWFGIRAYTSCRLAHRLDLAERLRDKSEQLSSEQWDHAIY